MKKIIILLIAFILCYAFGFSQTTYPVNQYIGAPSTLVTSKGGFKSDSAFILPTFADTSKANLSTYIKKYPGTLIRVKDTIYFRSADTTKWLPFTNSSSGGNFWKTKGVTILDSTTNIKGSNQILTIGGNEEDMAFFSVTANDINISTTGGTLGFRIGGLNNVTDTTSYKPLVRNSSGRIEQSNIWGSSSGGGQNGRFGNDTATIVMAKVHNNSGVVLTNGKVVFLATSGTNADAPSVRLANNKADSTSANTFGFVSGSIAVNDTGWIILSGKIEKLNTAAFSNGDVIYLDSISGQWTKSKPKAPYHMVYLGVVVKSNAGNGSIYVKCQNGYELDEIHDVQITSVQNNQILVYSDTQKVWKNRSIYSVVDTINTIATKTNLSLKLNISDTATMLSPYLRSNTASATYLAKSDSTTYYTKYRSDTSRTNIYNALLGKQGTLTLTTTGTSGASTLVGNTLNIPQYAGTTYTFSTGLTNSSGTVTNNLSTGVAGGQSVVGGTAASENLTLSSTTNATKGKLLFGTSAYFENTNRLGINTSTDAGYTLDVNGTSRFQNDLTASTGIIVSANAVGVQTQIKVGIATTATQAVRLTNAGSNVIPEFMTYTGTNTAGTITYGMNKTNGFIGSIANSSFNYTIRGAIQTIGTNNTAGSEAGDLLFLTQSGGTAMSEKMRITGAGGLTINATNTATGTTGNQTINKASGTVNIAAAGTNVTVTNSLVTASSIVFAVIRTNDATATIKNVVPAAGSFTINLNAAATAETSIGFFVIN